MDLSNFPKGKIPVIEIDSAACGCDMERKTINGEAGVEFHDDADYKYLTAFPCGEFWCAFASKDLKEWAFCFGATIDGNKIDIMEFTKDIQRHIEETA